MDLGIAWEIAQKAGPFFDLLVLLVLGAIWARITILSGENTQQIAAQSETTSAMERLADAMEGMGKSASERDRLQAELIRYADQQKLVGDERHVQNTDKLADVRRDLAQAEQRLMSRMSEVMQAINNGAGRG